MSINGSVITLTYADGTTENFSAVNIKGIASIAKTSTVGLVDTYTITYTDGTSMTFTVTNGQDGGGDMNSDDYDPDDTVKDAGGIVDYVESQLPTVLESTTYVDASGTRTFTFSDASITTTSRIDYYANVFGVVPTGVTVSSGSLSVDFDTSDGVTECAVEIK